MGPLVTASISTRCAPMSISASRKGPSSSSTAALKLQGYENGFFLGGCLFEYVISTMR